VTANFQLELCHYLEIASCLLKSHGMRQSLVHQPGSLIILNRDCGARCQQKIKKSGFLP